MKKILLFVAISAIVLGCTKEVKPGIVVNPDTEKTDDSGEKPDPDDSGDKDGQGDSGDGGYTAEEGLAYVFSGKDIPEFHVSVSLSEWNRLLSEYDRNSNTAESIHADVKYVGNGDEISISDIGLRLKGNTSRRRPEGNGGQSHAGDGADWRHCHYQLNFTKYNKDIDHELHGVKKLYLKWFKDDPAYVREVYCFDLFHRAGVWTAPYNGYCRLWIKVEGDSKETYLGVYGMNETIDGRYANARADKFGEKNGFLWKCVYGASLSSADDGLFGEDGSDRTYELKTQNEDYQLAKAQLQDFIKKVSGKGDESFRTWITQVCDVELLLKTYAVNVAVGMWDDYWKNKNNYYIYFNSKDTYEYKFFFIPYDYDNTLGTSHLGMDSGRQDPLNWGDNGNPLIYKLLKHEEFRKIYKEALLSLVDPSTGEFYYQTSMKRIRGWHDQIRDYVSNDTGEDMSIEDKPASFGNHSEYRLLDENNNFFKVRAETINKYCK